MNDANIVAWVLRLHWSWIQRSDVEVRDVVAIAYGAVKRARKASCAEPHLCRAAATAVIEFLAELEPTTLRDQL